MSIAGIAKEGKNNIPTIVSLLTVFQLVTTITISSWFFGDELTPLNITGVAITVCGRIYYLTRPVLCIPLLYIMQGLDCLPTTNTGNHYRCL